VFVRDKLRQIFKLKVAEMGNKSAVEQSWQKLVDPDDKIKAASGKFFLDGD
jgi:hypothetical protein